MPKKKETPSVLSLPSERIERAILMIRGEKVLLDHDLSALYDVQTKSLNQAVKRNLTRFPADFMFRLTKAEVTGTEPVTICDRFAEASRSSLPALRFY